jgi:hypothetical protein
MSFGSRKKVRRSKILMLIEAIIIGFSQILFEFIFCCCASG